ncbi:hypothetical protein SAMN05192566_1542 [Methylophilus rhizosphaerae]|uniref:GAPS4 PD-(D/E)XK nuclease domain-containing protein n=1 Tax=Methylophilus rhizosphaerae TaxID=492660 RepID=A0A1G9CN78_9PROT|nr:hypothetical protein [Methylophilus rhizosphaerae]SDK53039.1 hypothetical protein SAMN05192566_1542 [Methylophilus rhizosphaerae]
MSETINIAEVAAKLSKDIFQYFNWEFHPKMDDNFECTNEDHKSDGGSPKISHPADVIFFYEDPYLGKKIYLLTDLKSYKVDSITSTKLRGAFKSMCMTVECARESADLRSKYSIPSDEPYEVRGMLFVHNHDNEYQKSFYDAINKIDLYSLPISHGSILHFLGPHDIQRLFSIANDILRLRGLGEAPKDYTFYYPDLVMNRRQRDIWGQPATVESLTGPYLIIRHKAADNFGPGYLIYYNRDGTTSEEFEYLLDTLSRYQMLESEEKIRIRVTNTESTDDLKSVFHLAKKKYVKSWGFDKTREALLDKIQIDRITSVTATYNPGDMGWRE